MINGGVSIIHKTIFHWSVRTRTDAYNFNGNGTPILNMKQYLNAPLYVLENKASSYIKNSWFIKYLYLLEVFCTHWNLTPICLLLKKTKINIWVTVQWVIFKYKNVSVEKYLYILYDIWNSMCYFLYFLKFNYP